nr:MAG TPA: hypothetical protein [Caudoviricetes sp.]
MASPLSQHKFPKRGFNQTVISITSREFPPSGGLPEPYPLPATLLTLGLWL